MLGITYLCGKTEEQIFVTLFIFLISKIDGGERGH